MIERTKPATAKGSNGFPRLERITRIRLVTPKISPRGEQQQLKRAKRPMIKEAIAMPFCFWEIPVFVVYIGLHSLVAVKNCYLVYSRPFKKLLFFYKVLYHIVPLLFRSINPSNSRNIRFPVCNFCQDAL